ncbi:Hypothetical_protein [Hexamita inflata]|uniref:Hypothetical_protein n=1 Tax=Hexamita inflata TaxID=28002 RepID=A0AA86PXM0_9EUKA|nr:Hypothetical protein HINF_LOCUS34678 [Hexamita inflata]
MSFKQSPELMSIQLAHARQLGDKTQQLLDAIRKFAVATNEIKFLKSENQKLREEILSVESRKEKEEYDRGILLNSIDEKIFKITELNQTNPHHSQEAKMLRTIRRILSPSIFRLDQKLLNAPVESTIRLWKLEFKLQMGFIANVVSDKYTNIGRLADLYRLQRKIPQDEIQYGSILYDAICFISKTIILEDETKKNVLEVIDRKGVKQDLPIKYAFAYIHTHALLKTNTLWVL